MTENAAPARRPRTRILIVAAAVLAAVALLTAWQWTAQAYELAPGSMSGGTGGVEHKAGAVTEARLPLRPTATHLLIVSVRNPGPFPVTVTAVGGDSSIYAIDKAAMLLQPNGGPCCLQEHSVPFRPVEVPADRQLTVFLTIRPLDRPYMPCTRAGFGSVSVRFSVLGVDHEQRMPLDPVVAFEAPGQDCAQHGGLIYES
jgi:hypothetical protein